MSSRFAPRWWPAAALLAAVFLYAPGAKAFETEARQAIVIDVNSGTILFEQNADERMPTASMSKIMTMFMVFEALERGEIALDDTMRVSEYAWRNGGAATGGSTMFLELGSHVTVEDLIRGVIIQSGNDASIVLAEGLAGTEQAFARRMTERAAELGLTNSSFANASGLDDPDHYSTARDLATLAQLLIDRFPQYYHYYSELEFTYGVDVSTGDPITQYNRNPLLRAGIGADGLKTGHTDGAGFGLTASAIRDGRRIVMVVNGLESAAARSREALRVMEWAFNAFETVDVFEADEEVEWAAVWMGTERTVPLVLDGPLSVTVPRGDAESLALSVRLIEPVSAPIAAGDPLGTLVIEVTDVPAREEILYAGEDVDRRGMIGRALGTVGYLVAGLFR